MHSQMPGVFPRGGGGEMLKFRIDRRINKTCSNDVTDDFQLFVVTLNGSLLFFFTISLTICMTAEILKFYLSKLFQ